VSIGVRNRAPRVERVGSTRLRILAMVLAALVLAGMVWSRLAYWQIARHGQLASQAQAQYREVVELPAIRGAIFDRHLTQLVVNTTVYSAFVSPDQVPSGWRDRVASALVSIVGADQATVSTTLASGSRRRPSAPTCPVSPRARPWRPTCWAS